MQPLDNLAGYTGQPCVYIRWIEEAQASYIGSTISLYKRYGTSELYQVYFFEEYADIARARTAEGKIIKEFLSCKLPLLNQVIPQRLSKRDKTPKVFRAEGWRDSQQIILEYLMNTPMKEVRPLEVAQALHMPSGTVRFAMRQLLEHGDLLQECYGTYYLAEAI